MNPWKNWLKRWWPAILWAIAISCFSTGAFTSENTGRIIIPMLHWLFPHIPMGTLFLIHHYIRKCAHFTEYFILSLLLLRGIRGENRGLKVAWALLVIAIVACYASLDEFHQSFVPGRTPAIPDVMIDTSGGIAAQAIAALIMIWKHLRESRREKLPQNAKGGVALWDLLTLVCFAVPIGSACVPARVAKVAFGGYALAIAIGLMTGTFCAWMMSKGGRRIGARIMKEPEAMRERYFRALYIGVVFWIIFALFVGFGLSSATMKLIL